MRISKNWNQVRFEVDKETAMSFTAVCGNRKEPELRCYKFIKNTVKIVTLKGTEQQWRAAMHDQSTEMKFIVEPHLRHEKWGSCRLTLNYKQVIIDGEVWLNWDTAEVNPLFILIGQNLINRKTLGQYCLNYLMQNPGKCFSSYQIAKNNAWWIAGYGVPHTDVFNALQKYVGNRSIRMIDRPMPGGDVTHVFQYNDAPQETQALTHLKKHKCPFCGKKF